MKYRILAVIFTLAVAFVLPLGYAVELADPIEQKTHDIMKVEEEQAEKNLESEEAADANIKLPLKPAEVEEAVEETADVPASEEQAEQSTTQSAQ